jgi:cytosine permease
MSAPIDLERVAGHEHIDPDYPIDPVPPHARKSLFSLAIVLLGFTFFTPTMLASATIGPAYEFWPLMGVLVLGAAVLGIYVAVLGGIGARTGLTTVLMARYSFGDKGSKLVSLLLGGTQVGWYGVTVGFLATLLAQTFGWEGRPALWGLMIVAGAVMGLTAYYGYTAMYWLSVVSVPLLLVLAFWVTFRSFDEVGGLSGMAAQEPTTSLGLAAAVTIIVGTFASGGTQAPNWTRFARTPTVGFWAALIAFFVGELLMLFFGAIGALSFGESDFVAVLLELGLVTWGVVFLIANLWTTNDNTAYNFGVAGAEIFNSPTKKPFVIGGVAIGTLLAVSGIYDNLITYLVWLGILIPPVGGVIIGDYLARWRHGMPAVHEHDFPAVRWETIAAYALGALVAWWTDEMAWGIPPVNGVLVALLAVVGADRLFADRTRARTPA